MHEKLRVIGSLWKRQGCDDLMALTVALRRLKDVNELNLLRVRQSLIDWVLARDHSSFFTDTRKRHMRPKWFFVRPLEGGKKVLLQFTKLICRGALHP